MYELCIFMHFNSQLRIKKTNIKLFAEKTIVSSISLLYNFYAARA